MKKDNEATWLQQLIRMLDDEKDMMEQMLGVKLTYFPQTLKKMEKQLDEMYPFGEQDASREVALVIGAYLGETIRRNVKARNVTVTWGNTEGNPFEAELRVEGVPAQGSTNPATLQIKPMLRAFKFLNIDRADSLYAMYAMVQDMCQGRVGMEADEKWRHTPRGYQYRTIQVDEGQQEKQ